MEVYEQIAAIFGHLVQRKGRRAESGLGVGRRSGNKTAFLDQLKRKRRRAPIQLFIDTFTAESARREARNL